MKKNSHNRNRLTGRLSTAKRHPLPKRELTVLQTRLNLQAEQENRRRMEHTLEEAREKSRLLEFILNRSPVIAVLWRVSDGWPVEYISENICHFGYTADEFMRGKLTYTEIVHPEDLQRAVEEVAENSRCGRMEFTQEYRIVTRSGENRWVEDHTWVCPPVRNGNIYHQGLVIDVTERRKAEANMKAVESQLQQMQRMEALGTFASGLAHDFNNVLTAVLSSTELLAKRLSAASPEYAEVQDLLDVVRHGENLTGKLMAFARRQTMTTRIINLNDLIAGLENILRPMLQGKITIRYHLSPTPAYVRADPVQMEQVILNLAINARDAMPEGGSLMISTGRFVWLPPQPEPPPFPDPPDGTEFVTLIVQDTGPGMAPEVKARIFEPFFTTKGRSRGTGLGLATVYGIVKQHGGYITVDSAPCIGTTFQLFLPQADACENTPPAPV